MKRLTIPCVDKNVEQLMIWQLFIYLFFMIWQLFNKIKYIPT